MNNLKKPIIVLTVNGYPEVGPEKIIKMFEILTGKTVVKEQIVSSVQAVFQTYDIAQTSHYYEVIFYEKGLGNGYRPGWILFYNEIIKIKE